MTEQNRVAFDFTPETHMLIGQASSSLGWKKCLGELIDNSFDAKATSVKVAFAGNRVVIEDDGIGCTEVDAFFRQGKHKSRHGIGVYGVGLKDAALWLWGGKGAGTTEVRSCTTKAGIHCVVDWKRIVDSGQWTAYVDTINGGMPGTRLTFGNVSRKLPPLDTLKEQLGYLFFPAIEAGRSITIKKSNGRPAPIPAFVFPTLDHVVECESEVAGKPFRVRAGVVQEGQHNPYPGFTIAYKHRVITTTSEGCGAHGTARFVGIVKLGDEWRLSRNKDELLDDSALLAETLYSICLDTLENAAAQNRSIELTGIEAAIAKNLQSALNANKKAKRDRGSKKGTVKPAGSGKRHRNASRTQLGNRSLTSRIGSCISVQFVSGLKDLGQAEFNESGALVSLNEDHGYVRWARDHVDTNTLTALAATVLAIDASVLTDESRRQKLLPGIEEDDIRCRFIEGLSLYTSDMVGTPEPSK
jgi:hypothetical protein